MIRNLVIAVFSLSLIFTAACSSKKKSGDGVAGEVDGNIDSTKMNWNPAGSDSGEIQGLKTINFEYDRATLNESARQDLAGNAEWIKSNSNVTIQIEGHCDSRGSVEYNLALGERRAKSVKNYLVNLGIDSKRLTIISYGEEKPVASGDSESVYSKNRRANFVPLPN